MPRFLLAVAFLAHLLPGKDSASHSHLDPDEEKAGSDGAHKDDVEDHDHEHFDASDDEHDGPGFTEGEEDGPHPTHRRGVRLVHSSSTNFHRPSLPKWLVKIKHLLVGSPGPPDEKPVAAPNYRRAPIISGSLIPFSILLQIPGLTEQWYVRTSGNVVIETHKNPALLEISLILSMVLVVFANLALICRFLERRVKRCTILCILALSLHDILNIVTVAVFGVRHRFSDGFTYGDAYWMTICSTVISLITNVILIWDFVRTPNFAQSGSGVTRRQRSLVIITMIFLSYVAFGALIFSLMMSLTFLNGLFFTIVTTLTVGFGDIVPVTTGQRVATCIYATFGIIILGAALRLTAEAVLEDIEVGYRHRLQTYKKHRSDRKRERGQVRRWCAAVERRLVERELDVWTPDKPLPPSVLYEKPNIRHQGSNFLIRGTTFMTQPMRLNTEALSTEELESAAQEAGVSLEDFIGRKYRRHAPNNHHHHHHHSHDQGDQHQQQLREPLEFTWTVDYSGGKEPQKTRVCGGAWWKRVWSGARWRRVCKALRLEKSEYGEDAANTQSEPSSSLLSSNLLKVLEGEERRSLYTKLALSWALFFTFWTIGSLIFSETEGWTYGQAMYFCFIAFTTIGYGDFAPETPLGRAIFVFWALFGVSTMTVLFAVLADALSSKYHRATHHNKSFDRAVSRYRQGHDKSTRRDSCGKCQPPVSKILQANLARVSSRQSARPIPTPQPRLTLDEADKHLRARMEPFPAMVLKEVHKFREHTRYFFIASGRADALSLAAEPEGTGGVSFPQENSVPEGLKILLDEIAQEEGFDERLKQEVWDDEHTRNTLVALSLEKGVQSLIEAAEHALEMLVHRDQLLATEEERDVTSEPRD